MSNEREDMISNRPAAWDSSGGRYAFGPWLTALWGYRRVMAGIWSVLVALAALALVLAVLLLPSDRIGTTEFRLTFDGAVSGKYPNGVPFSYDELVSEPVLSEVFQADSLSRYGTARDFSSEMFVLHSSRDLELLDLDYQARLADSRLSTVDRARLEAEYETKRASLESPDYSLNIRQTAALKALPPEMMAKILQDVLLTWARQAAERKGALRYDVPLVSSHTIDPGMLERSDYIVGVDMLRAQANRLESSIQRISDLPGAALVKSKSGLTLNELRVRVEDDLQFRVQPLFELVRATGLTKDPVGLDLYFRTQLTLARIRRDEAAARAAAYEGPLRSYTGASVIQSGTPGQGGRGGAADAAPVVPQLGDSFLAQLVALSRQADDVKFRQELTRAIVREDINKTDLDREVEFYEGQQVNGARSGIPSIGRDALIGEVRTRAADALKALDDAADQAFEIYSDLSSHNLAPEVGLFTVTAPFRLRTTPSLPSWKAGLIFVSTVLLLTLVIPAACLVHFYLRSRRAVV